MKDTLKALLPHQRLVHPGKAPDGVRSLLAYNQWNENLTQTIISETYFIIITLMKTNVIQEKLTW